MQRRTFAAGLAATSLALPAWAQSPKTPAEGTEYRALQQPAPVEAPAGKIEVVEFFWYSCPHCNAFEPALEAWSKKLPADVVLRRVPVAFREDFVPQQRLYYALEALGRMDLHGKVFHAIHQERQPLNRDDAILAWAQRQGLDRARFQEAFNAFGTTSKARRAIQLQDAYQVDGVPSLGVAGRFYTDGEMTGSMPVALQVVDYLVAEVRQGR
mgnify:CR=1 FL=1